ncbi:MAG TPA: hypothetical protein VM864_05685 [Pyrinomonadaceae bacterium]|jgi:hypothetical protein|nr:hypothetical protein [Pyrinomonadaceae bacterium]
MTSQTEQTAPAKVERRRRAAYAALTLALALSQLWAFAAMRDLYPFAAWRMMSGGGEVREGYAYFIARGESASGETVDIRPARLTDALYARTWGLVEATVGNGSFRLRRPHPANAAALRQAGGFDKLPRGARVPELLRAWGEIYNEGIAPDSPRRLRAVRLDAYRRAGGRDTARDELTDTWSVEL